MKISHALLLFAFLAVIFYGGVWLMNSRESVAPDEGVTSVSRAVTFQSEKRGQSGVEAIERTSHSRQRVATAPGPPTNLRTGKPQTAPVRMVSAVGRDGKTVQVPVPPERVPSTTGSPNELLTLEKIRQVMPDAYMVKQTDGPPPSQVAP